MSVLSEINAEIEAERPALLEQNFKESLLPGAKVSYRFNGGSGAILCSVCNAILQAGSQIDHKALDAGEISPQYCEEHEKWLHDEKHKAGN